jgi:APA family basic amino acid/polyamine antiporter
VTTSAASASADATPAQLPREMGVGSATVVIVANMIGTGIFTTTGFMLGFGLSPRVVLLCWLLGGLIALAGALCYAELATTMPHAGGEYVYLREIYGPLPAFLTGWTSFFVGFAAPGAAAAVGAAKYLAAAELIPAGPFAEKSLAVLFVAALTAVHFCGLRLGTRVQNVLTGLNVTLLLVLIAAGLAASRADWSFLGNATGDASPVAPLGLGTALLLAMFGYSGWNAAAYLSEELRDPARTLPRSLLLGTAAVTALYLLLNLVYFAGATPPQLAGQVAVAEIAVRNLFGSVAAGWLAVLIALGLVSALSAYTMIGPRVYYAMARDGLFFRFAARVHPRFRTPSFSIVAQGVIAALMAATGTFEQLLFYIGFALMIFPWMAVLGVLLLRRREPQRDRPYRVWGYPLTPVFFLLAMAAIMVVSFLGRPGPALWAIGTVAAGIPAYFLIVRNKR